MRGREERSYEERAAESQQIIKRGYTRRIVLLGGASVVASLAGSVWWFQSHFFQSPTIPAADPHRILNLPLPGDPPHPSFLDLPRVEYAWLPDSKHLAVALTDKVFLVNVKTGQIVWQQTRSLERAQDAVLQLHWLTDGKQIQIVQVNGVPGAGQIAWPTPFQTYDPGWRTWEGAFSTDQTYLAFIRPKQDSAVQIWNIA
jgi:WD40 repeat protein